MRLLSSLGHYLVTTNDAGVQVHSYASADVTVADAAGPVHLHMQTDYPWQGTVMITVEQAPASSWQLSLRVPGWCTHPVLKLNGRRTGTKEGVGGYLTMERAWKVGDCVELDLPMPVRLIGSHPRLDATRGCAAIERGPLVYCLESADQPDTINLMDAGILVSNHYESLWRDDLLDGVVVIKARGWQADSGAWGDDLYRPLDDGTSGAVHQALPLTLIPYYAWDNRGLGAMRVWLPLRQ